MAAPTILILDANGRRGEELRHDAADHLRIAGGAGPLLCWSYVRSGLEWVGGGAKPAFCGGVERGRQGGAQDCRAIRADSRRISRSAPREANRRGTRGDNLSGER